MTDEVVHLANVKHDCTLWTPADALRSMLADIESGEIEPVQLIAHYLENTSTDRMRHGSYQAKVSYAEHIALLAMAHDSVMENWREE